jgi:hypothetical protein
MTRIYPIRDTGSCRLRRASFATRLMRSESATLTACRMRRHGAIVSPVLSNATPVMPAHGFPYLARTGAASSIHPLSEGFLGHEPLSCSCSSQALLRAYPSPGGTRRSASPFGALRVWVSGNKFPAQTARGFGPECGPNFLPDPPQKARHRPWEPGPPPFVP